MRINILCPDGEHYVRAAIDGTLDAVATIASVWETFELEEISDGRFAIRTLDAHPQAGMYVRAVGGGGAGLSADRRVANDHEKFTKDSLSDGKIAIRAEKGQYWRAKDAGGSTLDCLANNALAWESFTIELV